MIFEIVGTTGGLLILFAFSKVSAGKWLGDSFKYELCNLIGALLLVVYGFHKFAYVNIVLNIIWLFLAAIALLKVIRRRRESKKRPTTSRS